MNFSWDKIPVARILLPFLAGLLLNIIWGCYHFVLLPILLLLFFLFFVLNRFPRLHTRHFVRWLNNGIPFLFCFLLGMILCQLHQSHLHPNHFGHFLSDYNYAQVMINEPLIEKKNSYKAEVKVLNLLTDENEKMQSVCGEAILYFDKSSQSTNLHYGDVLWINNNLKATIAPKNPFEFNYQKYLAYQNIYHQAYVRHDEYLFNGQNKGYFTLAFVYRLRNYLLKVIQENISGREEVAIASALTLGYRHLLEDDMVKTYSETGAMHVLAVSGLHVGIMFMVLNFFFRFLDKRGKGGRWIKFGLIMSGIWLFAFVTGLPPSVCRAAVMFSFLAFGMALGRKGNIYNVIAASALALLIYNPFMITYVGFQLSYLAVLSIIFFQPKLYRLWDIENWLGDKVWQLTTVSAAAQLGTMPITLYYFHQFPVYFFLSNLVVIPFATFILSGCMLMYALSFLPLIPQLLGKVLYYIIHIQNYLLNSLQSLPFSVLKGLSISFWESMLLYAVILLITFFFLYNRPKYLKWALGVLIVIAGGLTVQKFFIHQQNQFNVYHINKGTAIEFVSSRQSFLIADTIAAQTQKQSFHISPNQIQSGIHQVLPVSFELFTSKESDFQNKDLLLDFPFIQFRDKRILLLTPDTRLEELTGMEFDYIIFSQSPFVKWEQLKNISFRQIIFDTSNRYNSLNFWKKSCRGSGYDCYDVRKNGAFVLKW